MDQKIELYIENLLVDLDDGTDVLLTKQYNDIFDPAKLLVDFTKTVSLPNTPRNNEVFGHVWSPGRQVDFTKVGMGTSFNPSKRASFQLFVGDSLVHSGYVRMIEVKWTGPNKWRYEVGLFGEVGSFLQEFGDKTLREVLDASTPYGSSMLLRGVALDRLWRARESSTGSRDGMYTTTMYTIPNYTTNRVNWAFDCSYRNLYVDLVDSENGMYSFSDQVVYDASYNSEGRYTKLPQQYSEHQVNLKKPYKQRFGFYTDMMLGTLLNKYGYTLNTSTDWTKMANPYWSQMMVTGIVPPDKTSNSFEYAQAFQGTTKDVSYYNVGNKVMYHTQWWDVSTLGTNAPSVFSIVNSSDGFYAPFWGVTNYRALQINASTADNNFYNVKFDITDPDKDLVQLLFTNPTNRGYYLRDTSFPPDSPFIDITLWARVKKAGTAFNSYDAIKVASFKLVGLYSRDLTSETYWGFFAQQGTGSNVHKIYATTQNGSWILSDLIKQKSQEFVIDTFKYNGDVIVTFFLNLNKYHGSDKSIYEGIGPTTVTCEKTTLKLNTNEWRISITSDNNVRTGTSIKYYDVLPNVKAKDFFTSYMKQFGLYLGLDGSIVSLYTRNEFFSNYSILDWTTRFDMSRDWSMVPLNFNTEWISLSYAENEDEFTKGYKTKYSRTYGSQYLNTGYEFNRNEYKLLDGNVFSTYALADMTTDIFGYKGQALKLPQLYKGEFAKSSPADKPSLVFSNGYVNNISTLPTLPPNYYWAWSDDTSVDNQSYNYSFYRPFSSSEGYFSLIQVKNPSYFGPNVSDGRIALQTSPYYPGPGNMTYSLDFGVPQEQYFGNVYDPSSTIYNRFWANYLQDRYNVNTKVFKGFFYLTAAEVANWKWSNIVWFKDAYWIVNKIIDYKPGLSEPTQVELVTINNLNNYVNGQYIPFEDTVNPKEPSTYSASMNPASLFFKYTGEPSGNTAQLDVSADPWTRWELQDTYSWITYNPSNGVGSRQVDLSIGVNTAYNSRAGLVYLRNVDTSALVDSATITQYASELPLTYDVSLYSDMFFPEGTYNILYPAEATTYTINVSTNSYNAWKASRQLAATTWITFNGGNSSTGWTTGPGSFTMRCSGNLDEFSRFAQVRVDSSAGVKMIYVEQLGTIIE